MTSFKAHFPALDFTNCFRHFYTHTHTDTSGDLVVYNAYETLIIDHIFIYTYIYLCVSGNKAHRAENKGQKTRQLETTRKHLNTTNITRLITFNNLK